MGKAENACIRIVNGLCMWIVKTYVDPVDSVDLEEQNLEQIPQQIH